MYSRDDRPFGDSDSSIDVDFVASWDFNKAQKPAMLNFVHFNDGNHNAVGYKLDEYGNVKTRADLCCTEELKMKGTCDTIGKVWWTQPRKRWRVLQSDGQETETKADSVPDLPKTKSFLLQSTKPIHVKHRFTVEETETHYVAVVPCPLTSQTLATDIQGTITFKNPYGYLSATRIAFLPYYGVLSGYYALLFLAFLYLCIRNCDMLLRLQYLLFGIIIVSFVEAILWFALYLDLDVSGIPVCCPLHSLAFIAVVTNVLKRTVSLCLLLAVCLGYGVVRPSLAGRTTANIIFMGILYGAFALNSDIRMSMEEKRDIDWWGLPVTAMDMVFVLWIYQALNQIHADLKLSRQSVKAKMYRSLYNILILFVILWITFSIFSDFVRRGWILLSWRFSWFLHCFWTNSYCVLLSVICWIWAPSTAAHKYAYSFQLPSSAEEADAYERGLSQDNEDIDDPDGVADV